LDLEGSAQAEAMLRELDVPVEALPIVIVPGRPLLRNPSSRELLDALGMSDANEAGPSTTCDLLVVGGGYIGLEMGSVWSRLGSEVVVIEFTPGILPLMDAELFRPHPSA